MFLVFAFNINIFFILWMKNSVCDYGFIVDKSTTVNDWLNALDIHGATILGHICMMS
jgi:hypothetical protein